MAEYIKREDVIPILARVMAGEEGFCLNWVDDDMRNVFMRLARVNCQDVPSIDIVRCKDCKYWAPHTQRGEDEDYDEYHNYCKYHMPDDEWYAEYWEADDYCSYGERKGE